MKGRGGEGPDTASVCFDRRVTKSEWPPTYSIPVMNSEYPGSSNTLKQTWRRSHKRT